MNTNHQSRDHRRSLIVFASVLTLGVSLGWALRGRRKRSDNRSRSDQSVQPQRVTRTEFPAIKLPPRSKIGMVGMTRFVIAMVLFAVLSTAAGLIGMQHASSSQQRQEAISLTGGNPERGEVAIEAYGCSSCHTIPGIRGANALVGPPLTKIGNRTYIGGVLSNTPHNLQRWLMNPPGIDPKTAMPDLHVSPEDARDIACYLYTLR